MIKAKKGLLIALFAAMMVFAFGATSAFASDVVEHGPYKVSSWGDKYATVTDTQNHQFKTDRHWTSDGLTVAVPKDDESVVGEIYYAPIQEIEDLTIPAYAYFYDLNGSSLVYGGSDTALDKTTWTKTAFEALMDGGIPLSVKTVQQDYTYQYDKEHPGEFVAALDDDEGIFYNYEDFGPWDVYVTVSDYDPTLTTDQEVKFTVKVLTDTEIDPKCPTTAPRIGSVENATITVKGTAKEPVEGNGVWYVDGVQALEFDGYLEYNGATQTVTLQEYDGWTLTYQKFDTSTGTWTTANSIQAKEAGLDYGKYRGVYTKGTAKVTTEQIGLVVDTADEPEIGWAKGNIGNTDYTVTESQAADPWAFIELDTEVASEAADVMAYAKEKYQIVVTKNVVDNNIQTWTLDFSDAWKADYGKALKKKYETLLANYDLGDIDVYSHSWSRNVTVIPDAAKKDDINFTECPNVTYKYKAIKKKAKSFTVEAVADSGKTVAYKIDSPSKKITIDSATGKITVAKKLKKGTYKVTVKAYTVDGGGYEACMAERQITVKIKK